MLMKNRKQLNYFVTHAKVHRVRKPAEQRSSNVTLELRKLEWTLHRALHYGIELAEKFATKSGPLLLVPCNCIGHIDFGLWLDSEASRHRLGLRPRSLARSSSRNLSQDLPARGFA